MSAIDTGLDTRKTAIVIAEAYQKNLDRLNTAYRLLSDVERNVETVLGAHLIGYGPEHISRTRDEMEKKLRVATWRAIVTALGLSKVMSKKRSDEFEQKCLSGDLPEPTLEIILEFFLTTMENSAEIAREAIIEVYDYLRRGASSHNRYKTNAKHASDHIGKKVILPSVVSPQGWGKVYYRVQYYYKNTLVQIDRVFHLLDGAGIPDGYTTPLIDAIHSCGPDGRGKTDYFSFRCFQNGNLHLTFTRPDLVEQLNVIAGGRNQLRKAH